MDLRFHLLRPLRITVAALGMLLASPGCGLMSLLAEDPVGPPPCPVVEAGSRLCGSCDRPGHRESRPCGPCDLGEALMLCREDGRWELVEPCAGNPFDDDHDGFAGPECFALERDCCGEADCDDDDPEVWSVGLDRDRDGHPLGCGGDDCDDGDPLRWTGHADLDDDGHAHAACGGDDCDDGDSVRWLGNADLDYDGHDAESCGGDDCDDGDPRRWTDHADLDGEDGTVTIEASPRAALACMGAPTPP